MPSDTTLPILPMNDQTVASQSIVHGGSSHWTIRQGPEEGHERKVGAVRVAHPLLHSHAMVVAISAAAATGQAALPHPSLHTGCSQGTTTAVEMVVEVLFPHVVGIIATPVIVHLIIGSFRLL